MPKVVLFKTPSTATGNDTYQNSFAQAGYDVQYIPVLQEAFHLDELCHIMRNNDTTWGGVVITSKRGAEGWLQAAFKSQGAAIAPSWNDVQLYSVGSTSLEHLLTNGPKLPTNLQLDTNRAVQAKSAASLLPLLLQTPNPSNLPLLLIRGDKSTEELQLGLTAARRPYTESIVYSTTSRPTLETDIQALLGDINATAEEVWLAFFSPSSAELVLDLLRSNTSSYSKPWPNLRTVAIGDTTRQFLLDQGVEVQAVAKEPTAEGLVNAVQGWAKGH